MLKFIKTFVHYYKQTKSVRRSLLLTQLERQQRIIAEMMYEQYRRKQ
jgi:hypothetical protein